MKMFLRCFSFLLGMVMLSSAHGQELSKRPYHVVQQGQTLFSIARMHNADVNEVIDCNTDLLNSGLSIGDTVLLSCRKTSHDLAEGFHRVQQGETLFSIAALYGIVQKDIMQWNDLDSVHLEIGQLLKVAETDLHAKVEWANFSAPELDIDSLTDIPKDERSSEERLYELSLMLGGDLIHGQDIFHVVDDLEDSVFVCCSSFIPVFYDIDWTTSLHPQSILSIESDSDTLFTWVNLDQNCFHDEQCVISRSLVDKLNVPILGRGSRRYVILNWHLVRLSTSFSEE